MNERPIGTAGESADALILHTLRETVKEQSAALDAAAGTLADMQERLSAQALDFLDQTTKRKAELNRLLTEVGRLKQLTATVVHQRDVCERALRTLVTACGPQMFDTPAGEWGQQFDKAWAEAEELLKVIDAAKRK